MSDRPPGSGPHSVEERLTSYLLGELIATERAEVHEHLGGCSSCREALSELDEAFVATVETLPPVAPPERAWRGVVARTRARLEPPRPLPHDRADRWLRVAWLGSLSVSVLVTVLVAAWGYQQRDAALEARRQLQALEARVEVLEAVTSLVQARADGLDSDQGRLVRWLARDDVTVQRLALADDGVAYGSVLFLPDGRALIALRQPAGEGRTYRAWGVSGDRYLPLASFAARTFEVDPASASAEVGVPIEALAVSLEDEAATPAPPEAPLERAPDGLLGSVPTD